jgi:hypothetical protein
LLLPNIPLTKLMPLLLVSPLHSVDSMTGNCTRPLVAKRDRMAGSWRFEQPHRGQRLPGIGACGKAVLEAAAEW